MSHGTQPPLPKTSGKREDFPMLNPETFFRQCFHLLFFEMLFPGVHISSDISMDGIHFLGFPFLAALLNKAFSRLTVVCLLLKQSRPAETEPIRASCTA